MLLYALYTIFILACIVLIISVLLQPGKADAGALFSSSVSSTAFGPRGTQTLLAKLTIIAAAVFMLAALMLSLPYFTGSRSVLQSVGDSPTPQPTATPAPAQQPAATPQTNSGGDANANSTAPAGATNSNGAGK